MFPSSSLPFGIKRWSRGGLSSGLLHQAVVKGPFPSGRKQKSLALCSEAFACVSKQIA